MGRSKGFLIVLGFLLLAVLAGCNGKADLVATHFPPPEGPAGFCQLSESNQLTVMVVNAGDADTPVSVVKVEFFPGGVFTEEVVPVPQGSIRDVTFPDPIPGTCFNPDCDFQITVDSSKKVSESIESNNTANGICIG